MAVDGKSHESSEVFAFLANRVHETAETANFVTSYGDAKDGTFLLLHSNLRADGVLLEALVRTKPSDTLIVKLVKGLLAGRKRGHWGNTQENCHVLLAMDQYFNRFERETPNFVARGIVLAS
jgi:alpha-2-macroglobulin